MIQFLEIKDNLQYKDFAKTLYEEAFPIEERWNFDAILENNENKNYSFYSLLDGDIPIGIVIIWNLEYFNFIEYFAVDKKFRGKNYGSQILIQILDSLKDKLTVIEVEPYELNEIAKKRINWYLRHNFILAEYDYDMPIIDKNKKAGKMKMKIMTTKKIKNREEHDKITNSLYEYIYKTRLENEII